MHSSWFFQSVLADQDSVAHSGEGLDDIDFPSFLLYSFQCPALGPQDHIPPKNTCTPGLVLGSAVLGNLSSEVKKKTSSVLIAEGSTTFYKHTFLCNALFSLKELQQIRHVTLIPSTVQTLNWFYFPQICHLHFCLSLYRYLLPRIQCHILLYPSLNTQLITIRPPMCSSCTICLPFWYLYHGALNYYLSLYLHVLAQLYYNHLWEQIVSYNPMSPAVPHTMP